MAIDARPIDDQRWFQWYTLWRKRIYLSEPSLHFDFQMKILLDLTSFSSRNAKVYTELHGFVPLETSVIGEKGIVSVCMVAASVCLLKDAGYANRRGMTKPEANFRTTLALHYSFFLAGFYIFPVKSNLPYFGTDEDLVWPKINTFCFLMYLLTVAKADIFRGRRYYHFYLREMCTSSLRKLWPANLNVERVRNATYRYGAIAFTHLRYALTDLADLPVQKPE